MTKSERNKKWRKDNPEKYKANLKKWNEANPRAYKKCAGLGRDYFKNSQLKRYYGIDLKTYNNLQTKQDNKCAICNKEETAIDSRTGLVKYLSVDHCHKTGKIRGLLCVNCNQGLGKFKDCHKLLEKATTYLVTHEYNILTGDTDETKQTC